MIEGPNTLNRSGVLAWRPFNFKSDRTVLCSLPHFAVRRTPRRGALATTRPRGLHLAASTRWVKGEAMPLLIPFSDATSSKIFGSGIEAQAGRCASVICSGLVTEGRDGGRRVVCLWEQGWGG